MSRTKWLAAICGLVAMCCASGAAVASTSTRVPSAPAGVQAAAVVASARQAALVLPANRPSDRDRIRRCQYPPSRTPSITLTGPNHAHPGRSVILGGTVTLNRCPLAGATVALYTSDDGVNWTPTPDHPVQTTLTQPDGGYAFLITEYATHWYRAVVLAGAGNDAALSNVFRLPSR